MDLHHALIRELMPGPAPADEACAAVGVEEEQLNQLLTDWVAEGAELTEGPDGLRASLRRAWGPLTLSLRAGRPVEHHPSIGSTNARARALAAKTPWGAPLPVVVADHQTEGRGRQGRRWEAEPGAGILMSVVLRPAVPPHEAPRCVLLWAAALAELLDLQLKWPNDLVCPAGGKVGGLLAELDAGIDAEGQPIVRSVVLGVGLNIEQPADPTLTSASSLRRLGRAPEDRAALVGAMVRAIDAVDPHAPGGLDRWRARAHTLGRRVRVGEIEGIAEAIREDGALLIDGRPILTGDVELVTGERPDEPQ